MKRGCVTDFEVDSSLEGQLKSRVNAIVWDYDEETGKLDNPHETTLLIPRKTPSQLLQANNKKYAQAVEGFNEFNSAFLKYIQKKHDKAKTLLDKSKPKTKKHEK